MKPLRSTAVPRIGYRLGGGRLFAWRVLFSGGVALVVMGLYFLLLRPALLREDLRYIGADAVRLASAVPGLLNWLPKVFAVLGGFMLGTGILTCYLAWTSLRLRAPGALAIAVISGAASIGVMVIVNFIISSDFRWVLLVVAAPWPLAAVRYWIEEHRQ